MKTKTNIWLHNLVAAVVTGGATSGLSALGITVADAAGANIGGLNFKQVGMLFVSGALVGLLAYLKQSPLPPPEDDAKDFVPKIGNDSTDRIVGFILAAMISIYLFGCATQWIDKVSQARYAAAKVGYRAVAEFNGYYSAKTNQLNGTTPTLEANRFVVYSASQKLGYSLLTLEKLENDYRAAPTNQQPVLNAINVVSANASNIVSLVNQFKK